MRTRFPPSPTGLLHVGGLRTALYNYLLARKTGGAFVLRIEDTDQEREVPGAVENIIASLLWAGVVPDEGVTMKNGAIVQVGDRGPYIQSERTALYRRYADELLEKGHAYRCFCTKDRLDEMRKLQQERGLAPMYDRHCLGHCTPEEGETRAAAGEKHVVRMKVPHDRTVEFQDGIRGAVKFAGSTIDDQVLLKSDGFPTYHLANVVDDHLMGIDLVLRGEEWLSSTPKHVLLYEALGWETPEFAHVPLLLNADKTKLSKRQNSVSVQEYIDRGYLPEAMLNFLALLGWNPGTTQEVFTLEELIQAFSLDRVQKAGAIFDLRKLDWLQGQWIRRMPPEVFAEKIRPLVAERFSAAKGDARFAEKSRLVQERVTFLKEAPDMLGFFYEEPAVAPDLLANAKQKVTPDAVPGCLDAIHAILEGIPDAQWTSDEILARVKAALETNGMKLGQLLWPLRAALTGREYSPGATEVAAELGKEATLRRIKKARSAR